MEFCSLGFAIIATYFCALKYVATYDAEKDAFGHFQVFLSIKLAICGCFHRAVMRQVDGDFYGGNSSSFSDCLNSEGPSLTILGHSPFFFCRFDSDSVAVWGRLFGGPMLCAGLHHAPQLKQRLLVGHGVDVFHVSIILFPEVVRSLLPDSSRIVLLPCPPM